MPTLSDRRRKHRFSLRLPVRCRRKESPSALCPIIVSETMNISSDALLFRTEEALLPGQVVEASLDWPARLDNRTRLKLVVEGRVVRTLNDQVAMLIERYEFRTRRAEEQSDLPAVIGIRDCSANALEPA